MSFTRRNLLKKAVLATIIPGMAPMERSVFGEKPGATKNEKLKIGLIGCGGRGSGAARQALSADPDTVLYAVGDLFRDKIDLSLENLQKVHAKKVVVNEAHKFSGFDSFQKVIDSGVDVVLLCTPPHFRPEHLEAAVKAGKHVFCEKPVAVDAPGVRKVLEAAKSAEEKKLSLLSGFCFRYNFSNRECMKRILDGQIGEISSVFNARLGGILWSHPRKAEWSEAEYQLRNWIYYTWLSGDMIVEQAVHSIDLMSWAMGGKLPEYAIATGGREVRTEPIYGNVYDHFAVTYGYENESKGIHFSRQQSNCYGTNVLEIAGTKGNAFIDVSRGTSVITGQNPWKFSGQVNDMFQTEHDEFFASIRSGIPMNDGEWMAHSTLIAIMGRMAAYTGKKVSWEEALNSRETLGPSEYGFDMKLPEVVVAKPGITAFY